VELETINIFCESRFIEYGYEFIYILCPKLTIMYMFRIEYEKLSLELPVQICVHGPWEFRSDSFTEDFFNWNFILFTPCNCNSWIIIIQLGCSQGNSYILSYHQALVYFSPKIDQSSFQLFFDGYKEWQLVC
jgi:hypothetical protein